MRVRWTGPARRDLEKIRDYIAIDSPKAASALVRRIKADTRNLSRFPELGRADYPLGTRELVVAGTPYLVSYEIMAGEVHIREVYHGAQERP